jgi:glycosyltransferase involved in cell wall biosynthesis
MGSEQRLRTRLNFMDTIRLLQVIPSFGCGGAERMVVTLMTHLDPKRFKVAAVSLAGPEGSILERKLADQGFPVDYLGKGPGVDLRMLQRIRNIVRKFRPDVIHSHLCLHYLFPALIGLHARPHVATIHLPADGQYKQLLRPLAQLAFQRNVIPVAVSQEVAQWMKQFHGVKDCLVIPNGIPVSDYQHPSVSRHAWRKEHGFTDVDLLFVCVARLEKQKNHSMLLKAFAHAFRASGPGQLVLAGDGACRQELERQVRELRLEGKIHFLGRCTDIPELLGASDVFVLPSQNEGNPLALMEAMAAGLPVVATAVGGVPELLEDRKSGFLVAPGDWEALGGAMMRLLGNIEMRRRMAASAAQRAIEVFSATRMAQGYMELYERSLHPTAPDLKNEPAEVPA